MSRYALAAIAAAVTFPVVWFAVRLLSVLIADALGKAQEDFPPARANGEGPWAVLIAAVCASAVTWLVMRRR